MKFTTKHKGFTIKYEEFSNPSRAWSASFKYKGNTFDIFGEQLVDVKRDIDEALKSKTYKPTTVYKVEYSATDRQPIRKDENVIFSDRWNGEAFTTHRKDNEYVEERKVFLGTPTNLKIIEKMSQVNKDIQVKIQEFHELRRGLEPFDKKLLIEDDTALGNILSKSKRLSEENKKRILTMLQKITKKSNILCLAALKDSRWDLEKAKQSLLGV